MMNGSRPLSKHPFPMSPCGCLGGRQGNLSVTISTKGVALLGKWLCYEKLMPATAVKVFVTDRLLKAPSCHVKR